MKKIYLAALLALGFTAAQAQTVKIMKDGQTIASYSLGEYDAVMFTADSDEEDTASAVAGTYSADRAVTLVEMAAAGVVVADQATITITVASSNTVDIALPSCTYTTMVLPGVTVSNVPVYSTSDGYTLSAEFSGETEEGKSYSGTISATIVDSSTWTITETMKYGSMPYTLSMAYTPAE